MLILLYIAEDITNIEGILFMSGKDNTTSIHYPLDIAVPEWSDVPITLPRQSTVFGNLAA